MRDYRIYCNNLITGIKTDSWADISDRSAPALLWKDSQPPICYGDENKI